MDDVGQLGGGVFFMLTFSRRVYSFTHNLLRRASSSGFHLDFDLFTSRCQQGVKAAGCSGREKTVDSLPSGAQIVNQLEIKKKKTCKKKFLFNFVPHLV